MIVYTRLFLVLIKEPIYSNSKCRRLMQQINTIFDYVVQSEKNIMLFNIFLIILALGVLLQTMKEMNVEIKKKKR